MLKGTALRHQMVLPQQQKIYDYWRSKCRGGAFPSREDIHPEALTELLPMTCLIEPSQDVGRTRYRYRLAGTGFYRLYNDEITGRYIDELPLGDRQAYWARILGGIVHKRRPTAGVTRPGTPHKSHLAQFWIRLPLSSNGEDIDMILGYDHLVKFSDVPMIASNEDKLYA
jgi:hypothetical protein